MFFAFFSKLWKMELGTLFHWPLQLCRLMTKPTNKDKNKFAQSDQSLRSALSGYLRTQRFFMRTAKTLIRLAGCPGWSESSLCAKVILLVLSVGIWGPNVSSCGQRRLWSDWPAVQADLSLRCAQRSFCWFCHVPAHIPTSRIHANTYIWVGSWVGRWCWVASSAGSSYYLGIW